MRTLILLISIIFIMENLHGQSDTKIKIWPGKVPGELSAKKEPVVSPDNRGNVTRLSEVTDPVLMVFPAEKTNNSGIGIIICPGGGYSILAVDLEGYEIAGWLNTLGINAFVLLYRVPDKQAGALQDIQRAISIVRSRSREWNINPGKIGVMGFSAGGSLSARVTTQYTEKLYPAVDSSDNSSCRPDFTALIYPAYLDRGPDKSLTPELKLNDKTPPVFIFATADDTHSNSALVMTTALRDAKNPVELHMLPVGGHGYGLRKWNAAAEAWPGLMEKWIMSNVMKK